MTYTVDNIPDYLDRAAERAAAEQKSPEAMIVDLIGDLLKHKFTSEAQ